MLQIECPDGDTLAQLLLGKLPAGTAERMESHLLHCDSCSQVAETVNAQDEVTAAFASQEILLGDEEIVADVIQRAWQLHSDSETMGIEDTLSVDPELPREQPFQAEQATGGLAAATDKGKHPAWSSMVEEPPEFLGRYRVIRPLGKGGMGAVYLAHDSQLDRVVAIKVPFFAREHGEVIDRFRREAKALAALQHPNICPVHDVAESDGLHFMTMAHIEGQPLSKRFTADDLMPITDAVKLVQTLTLALEEAHGRGVIHRDLKPSNIMINQRQQPIIMDFGLARRQDSSDEQLTQAGQVMGTPKYMPPEQVVGKAESIGPACDIYSLGVILYQLLTGKVPFEGDVLAVLNQIATDTPRPPSALRTEIDEQLDTICGKAMEKEAADRFGSMRDFHDALAAWLEKNETPSKSFAEKLEKNQDEREKSSRRASPQSVGSGKIWLLLAGLAAVVVIGMGLIFLASQWGDRGAGQSDGQGKDKSPIVIDKPPPVIDDEPIAGTVDILVWDPANPESGGQRLYEPGALPLREGDQIRLEVKLNRPAYAYVVWIDSQGEVSPVYPWKLGNWNDLPESEKPTDHISLPEAKGVGWPMEGKPGMETLVMFVRETPLPRDNDHDLNLALSGLPVQSPEFNPNARLWFVDGQVLTKEEDLDRAPTFAKTEKINDPLLQTQQIIHEKLSPHFDRIQAVSFANAGQD